MGVKQPYHRPEGPKPPASPAPPPRRLAEVPPEYGIWNNAYVDGLRSERDDLIEAVRMLLQSADASWYENRGGHDWREAVDRAHGLLN